MKYAIITMPDRAGTETRETFWLLDEKEGGILRTALAEFCERNKKKKLAAKLLAELDLTPNYVD